MENGLVKPFVLGLTVAVGFVLAVLLFHKEEPWDPVR